MNSSKVLALSAGLTVAVTLLVSASASAATSSHALSSRASVSRSPALFSADKMMASGGSKPCQLYYGCVPAPTPAPKGGGGADNPKGHQFAPAAGELLARENQPKDDRGKDARDIDPKGHRFAPLASELLVARDRDDRDDRDHDKKDHDKNDDRGLHGPGHRFAPTAA